MIKVLLVDDEKLALEYLETIIDWKYYGFEIVGITSDAEQAFKMFRKFRPHLIISDVKMPTMSGLELVTMIREIDKQVHILFMSGYKNFSYVRQAIRLGIDDYLLKSDVDEETFLRKILTMKEDIEKEKAKNQYTLDAIFESIFHKNEREEQYKNILDENEYVRIQKRYYYVLLVKNIVPQFVEKYIPSGVEQNMTYDYELREACVTQASDGGMNLVSAFPVNEKIYLGIFEMIDTIVSLREINERMYRRSLHILAYLNKHTSSTFSIYYYMKGCTVRQFGLIYEEGKQQLWKLYVNGKTHIAEFGQEGKGVETEKYVPSTSPEEIYKVINDRNKEAHVRYIEILKNAIEQEDYVTYLWYVKGVLEALNRFEGSLMGEKSGRRFNLAESSSAYDFRQPQEIVRFLEFKLGEIKSISEEEKRGEYSKVIQDALIYLQENYANQELSTSVVAQNINLSNSWLSTKFKEEVGIGVSDYLNGIRIQRARQYFERGEYMIYEVVELVGFTSSQYFSKIFKQYTGLTPNEYKRSKTVDAL